MDEVVITLSRDELSSIVENAVSSAFDKRMQVQLPEFYTATEVMKILNISRTTIHRLRKENLLVGITVNGHARFSKEEVEAFINRTRKAEVANGA